MHLHTVNNLPILGFHVTSHHHKIPLNSRCRLFDSRNGYSSVMFSQNASFCLSIHSFGKVAVIKKYQYFQVIKRVLYRTAMVDDIACLPTWLLHTKLSLILEILKYSYFVKIMTRKAKIGNLTNMTMQALSISGVIKVASAI